MLCGPGLKRGIWVENSDFRISCVYVIIKIMQIDETTEREVSQRISPFKRGSKGEEECTRGRKIRTVESKGRVS